MGTFDFLSPPSPDKKDMRYFCNLSFKEGSKKSRNCYCRKNGYWNIALCVPSFLMLDISVTYHSKEVRRRAETVILGKTGAEVLPCVYPLFDVSLQNLEAQGYKVWAFDLENPSISNLVV